MGLVVSLVHHIDAPTVTEFVEIFSVGVVRGTEEVDVRLLHQTDVLLIGGIVDIAPRLGVVVVTVHTAQFHVLAIDLKHLADDLDFLHAKMVLETFYSIAFIVF